MNALLLCLAVLGPSRLCAEPAQLRDAFAQVAERFGAVGFRG